MPFGLRRRLSAANGRASDSGVTLIELGVVMAIMGVLSAIAVWGFLTYSQAQDMSQTENGLLSEFRAAAQHATAESRTYCVSIDSATTYSLWVYSCDLGETVTSISGSPLTPKLVSSFKVSGSSLLEDVSFTDSNTSQAYHCASGSLGCVFFYPRGNSSAGTITISRTGSTATKVITVVGLTGRAYQSS